MNMSLLVFTQGRRFGKTGGRRHAGFTLVELIVVLAVIAVLAVIGLPRVQDLMIEGRAPEAAKPLQQAVAKLTSNRQAGGDWSNASTAELAAVLTGNTVLRVVTGATPSVSHDLNKSGATGVITFAPGTIAAANDSGKITVTQLDGVACPIIANAMNKIVHTMKVNATDVKTTAAAYNGGTAQTSCTDTGNTVEFQFR